MVEFEVHESHQSCIKLHKSEHYSKIHVCWYLVKTYIIMYHSGISTLLPTHLLGELVGRDPGHCLTMDVCLIVYALD